jgi:hypothetical protein
MPVTARIPRAGLAHDGGAVVLDRALADAKVGCNVLARVSRQHHPHHVMLAGRKPCDAGRGLGMPRRLDACVA